MLDAAGAANLARNVAHGTPVSLQLNFNNGRTIKYMMPVYNRAPATIPPLILQAPTDGGNTNGVTNIRLPANYDSLYHHLVVAVWEVGTDRIAETEYDLRLLAIQSATRTLHLTGALAGAARNLITAQWNPATRTFTMDGNDRILFAELD